MFLRREISKTARRICAFLLLCLISFSLAGCTQANEEHTVYFCDDGFSPYPGAVAQMLPSHSVEIAQYYTFTHLNNGAVTEAFDVQAESALESGAAAHWYPQYLATVVIAVDRDRTDAIIQGWRDLTLVNENVGLSDSKAGTELFFPAIAYGLEGESFTLDSVADLLGALQQQGHFARKTFEPPILICYDYQAAELIKSGRNMEIIIPNEGTLTYTKGLLSNTELEFISDVETILLSAGLRLPDGRCDEALYPNVEAYENATHLADYTHLSVVCQNTTRVLRREILHTRLYSSADTSEHQYFVLLYIILVVVWTASVIRRAMQKEVRRAALLTGIILLGWIIVRLVKYQLDDAVTLNRYLWYSYYLFQLFLPLVLLWLAWAIDRPEDEMATPVWLRVLSIINGALLVLVFTNDMHNWVFHLNLSSPTWSHDYGYGVVFYLIQAACVLPLVVAVVLLLVKSGRNPRKKGFIFSLVFCAVLALYGFGYVTRVPLAWDSDIAMVIGLLTLLFMEACLRTGMIPVNSKYAALFTHSPINMQIMDDTGHTTLSSEPAQRVEDDLWRSALSAAPLPVEKDENTLLFAKTIPGGTALWEEDISSLNHLHLEIEMSVRKLVAANAILAEEEKIKRTIHEENAKTKLMLQLEDEISSHTARLSAMIERLDSDTDRPEEMSRVALMLCYIKRRCNLFFRKREIDTVPTDEIIVYMDELAEIADYAGVKIIMTSGAAEQISVRIATIFYDLFYAVIDWATLQSGSRILVQFGLEHDDIVMRLLPSADARQFAPADDLRASMDAAGGTFILKDLDDAFGISLSFPKGGAADG